MALKSSKLSSPVKAMAHASGGHPGSMVDGESAYFLSVNRNKKSMTLNLKAKGSRAILKKLLTDSDILIENFKPGTMQRMGLDYERLSQEYPGLIYCSISGYGQTGPYSRRPGYDFMIQAQGGIMSVTGPADGEPHKVGVAIVDITAGLFAASAILSAMHHRHITGEGQYIDVALLDAQVAWLANVAHNYFAGGEKPGRFGNAHPNIVPYETFPTADGQIALAIGNDSQYRRFCEVVERPDLWQDERFQTNAGRVESRDILIPLLSALFQGQTSGKWLDLLVEAGIPVSPINDIPTVLNDPQITARQMVQEVEHATAGTIRLLGPVAKMSKTPPQIDRAPPTLGADTDELLLSLGYSQKDIAAFREAGVI
jgi:formyl-CoA transferase